MNTISVSVPGKIMLAGEYSILRGGHALAATVNSYLTVNIQALHKREENRKDAKFNVSSNLWLKNKVLKPSDVKNKDTRLDPLLDTICYSFSTMKFFAGNLHIDSDLNVSHGIGSSSALRLAVLLAMNALGSENYLKAHTVDWDLVREGFLLQKRHQSFASGYDFATQAAGGLVLMEPPRNDADWPGTLKKFPHLVKKLNLHFHPFVGGKGATTKMVTSETMLWLNKIKMWDKLKDFSNQLITSLLAFLEDSSKENSQIVMDMLKWQRQFFAPAPHFPTNLVKILEALPGCDQTWSFKTTGAGGEDAILVFGAKEKIKSIVAPALASLGWKAADFKFDESSPRFFKDKLH